MKIFCLFFLWLILPLNCVIANCEHTKDSFKCVQYISNYDGDTVRFNIPNVHPFLGENISIRIKGVDTAEIKTKNQCEKKVGLVSQKLVHNLLAKAKRVDLINIERDKYFRILADVMADGKNLKAQLLDNNLAYPYWGKTKKSINWCEQFQRIPASILGVKNEK